MILSWAVLHVTVLLMEACLYNVMSYLVSVTVRQDLEGKLVINVILGTSTLPTMIVKVSTQIPIQSPVYLCTIRL